MSNGDGEATETRLLGSNLPVMDESDVSNRELLRPALPQTQAHVGIRDSKGVGRRRPRT